MRTIKYLVALSFVLVTQVSWATDYLIPALTPNTGNTIFQGCSVDEVNRLVTCDAVVLPGGNHTLQNTSGQPYTLITNSFTQGGANITGPNLSIVVNTTLSYSSNRSWNANLSFPGNLTISNSPTGNFNIGGTFGTGNGNTITGSLTVGGTLTLGSNNTVTGNVQVASNQTANLGNAIINGAVTGGAINTSGSIGGGLTASGAVVSSATITGLVTITSAGTLSSSGTINGSIVSQGNVTITGTVNGNINSSAAVVNNGTVTGYINAPSVTGSGTAADVCNFGNNLTDACPQAGAVNHYQIVHDGAALVCELELVTIRACANANCDSFANTSASFTLNAVSPQTTVSVNGSFDGTGTPVVVALDFDVARSYTLTLSNVSDTPLNETKCDLFGANDCTMNVADSGFIVEAPTTIIAGSSFDLVVRTATIGACSTNLTGVQSLELGMDCINPDVCLLALTGNATAISELPNYTELTVNFVDGEAIIPMQYPDAGAITVAARKQIKPNAFIVGALTQDIVSRPANFSVITSPTSSAADFSADFSLAPVFAKAGEYFTVTIEALNAAGDVTPNYGNEVPAQEPQLLATPNYLAPLAGGTITLDSPLSKTDAGQFSSTQVRYSELGVIQLLAEQSGASYLGGPTVSGSSAATGRFVPAYFTAAEAYTPLLQPSQDDFTYVGQPLTFHSDFPQLVLTPRSVQGTIVTQYANSFFRYSSTWAARSYSHNLSCDGAGPYPLSFSGSSNALINNGDNTDSNAEFAVSLPVDDNLRYSKDYATPKAAFAACIDLQLTAADLTDQDNVCVKTTHADSCLGFTFSTLQGSDLLDGRLRVLPAYAPANDILDLQFSIEYFDGTGFRRNSRDNSTDYDSSWLAPLANRFVNFVSTANLTAAELVAEPLAATSVAAGRRLLSAPLLLSQNVTPGLAGQFDWRLDLNDIGLPWLGYSWSESCSPVLEPELNPCAPLEFGLFRGNDKVVYQREVGW